MKKGFQKFYTMFVLAPADKDDNVVVVLGMYYINNLKQELRSKKGGKDQESIQSSTTSDIGYHMGK